MRRFNATRTPRRMGNPCVEAASTHTERDQACIMVYTDYYYDGTEAMGVDLFVYDLENQEVAS